MERRPGVDRTRNPTTALPFEARKRLAEQLEARGARERGDDPARAIREMRNRKPRSKRTVDYQIVAAQLRARGRSN